MRVLRPRRNWAGLGLALTLLAVPAGAQPDEPESPALHGTQLRNLPAPNFELPTLSGAKTSLARHEDWILVLHFFEKEGPVTDDMLQEFAFFHSQGRQREIAYLGISSLAPEKLTAMAQRLGVKYELALDAEGEITRSYLGDKGTGIFLIDPQGTIRFVRESFQPTFRESIRSMLSQLLKELNTTLQARPRVDLVWRSPPAAPVFSGTDLDGKRRTAAEFRGKPLLLYFLEQQCSYCSEIAPQLSEVYHRFRDRIQFLGVASADPQGNLKRQMAVQGLDFPVILDPGKDIRRAFGALRGSPDIIWVDAMGQARWREFGAPNDIGALLTLEAKAMLGEARPETMSPTEYLGFRNCRVCHQAEFQDWLETPHATAMVSLDPQKEANRPECISCHVTGYQKPGGFQDRTSTSMVHVQCESCHGAGGGHGLAEGVARPDPGSTCLSCHRGKFELKQDLATSIQWMSHQNTPDAATLFAYRPERISEMQRLARVRQASMTFSAGTEYAGSESCATCHAKVFEGWKQSPHARALDTLEKDGKQETRACLACHTTGYGFLSGYRGTSTPEFGGVGCESCHGPGADHVAAGANASAASIYGLRSDCPTCGTEAVCQVCHDSENDPNFFMPENVLTTVHPNTR